MLDVSAEIGFEAFFSCFLTVSTGCFKAGFLSELSCFDKGFETLPAFLGVLAFILSIFSLFSFKFTTPVTHFI